MHSIHGVHSGVQDALLAAMRHARFLTRLIMPSRWPCVSGESIRSVQNDRGRGGSEDRRVSSFDVDDRCFERDLGEDEDRGRRLQLSSMAVVND